MRYTVANQRVELTKRDFLASGGEADVYCRGGSVYKIYHDRHQIIPPAKLKELSALDRANICRPIDYVYDGNNLVGLTFNAVKNAAPLCKFISNSQYQKLGITPPDVLERVDIMQGTIGFIHSRNCLIVDGNEFNYLVGGKAAGATEMVYFIDVDSYQTLSHKATALMPSIRDYHASEFSELTDWFSFAIVSCQMFLGIHPFKGRHPKIKGLEPRMKAGVSIFNKTVTVPSNVRPMDWIPEAYRDWYVDLFEKGKRLPPPQVVQAASFTPPQKVVTTTSKDFDIQLITAFHEAIWAHHWADGAHHFNQEGLCVGDDRYVRKFDKLCKVRTVKTLSTTYEVTECAWDILPNASQVYDGLLISDVLGRCHFYLPDGKACHILHIPELDRAVILDAKRDRNVVMVRAKEPGGDERLFRFVFDERFREYALEVGEAAEINFTVLDTGVGLQIRTDGEFEVFSAKKEENRRHIYQNKAIQQCMRLTKIRTQACFFVDNRLYGISLKHTN